MRKWKKRYGGTLESLKDRPRAPQRFPRKQTAEEERPARRYARKYRGDLPLGYEKACAYGYKRSCGCFKRTRGRFVRDGKKRRPRKNKPCRQAAYPGQKVRMDVKHAPGYCVVNGEKILPVHAKDECTRRTYREMYAEHSSVSAKDFPERPVKAAPLPVRTIQTDNGAEFASALLAARSRRKTLLEEALIERRIAYHRIRIAAPQRQGGTAVSNRRTALLQTHAHVRPGSRPQAAGGLPESVKRSHYNPSRHEAAQSAA